MDITVLYCDDCPSLNPTLERVKKVLNEENILNEKQIAKDTNRDNFMSAVKPMECGAICNASNDATGKPSSSKLKSQ